MLNYTVHFRNVNDFRNYANMTYRFHIAGYVEGKDFKENMYALLEILFHCPMDRLTMTLTKYDPKEIPELEQYLSDTGLLAETNDMAA